MSNMDEWMGAVDCIVTKAGPGTIAEAMIRGLPIMLSAFLPGQEVPCRQHYQYDSLVLTIVFIIVIIRRNGLGRPNRAMYFVTAVYFLFPVCQKKKRKKKSRLMHFFYYYYTKSES